MQYSVFICDLSATEKLGLKDELRDVMDQRVDSVAIVDLGPPDRQGSECFEFMGSREPLPPTGGPVVL